MTHSRCRARSLAALLIVGLGAAACGGGSKGASEGANANGPATVREGGGGEPEVVLEQDAAQRLGIRTETVVTADEGVEIPYAAVLYDPEGKAWAFVNTKELTFQRTALTITRIDGDEALLSEGPAVGSKVVTIGGAELYGAELGVGDDE
jgi:hypothetical protein